MEKGINSFPLPGTVLGLYMCHFIQSSHDLFYREGADISQDRSVTCYSNGRAPNHTDFKQPRFGIALAGCLLLGQLRSLFCKVCVLISGPGQKEQPLMVTNGKEGSSAHTGSQNFQLKWHVALLLTFHWSKQVLQPHRTSSEWDRVSWSCAWKVRAGIFEKGPKDRHRSWGSQG